jgi:hypothetical protein
MRNLTCPDTAELPISEYGQSNALPGEFTAAAGLVAHSHQRPFQNLGNPMFSPGPLINTVNPRALSLSVRLRNHIQGSVCSCTIDLLALVFTITEYGPSNDLSSEFYFSSLGARSYVSRRSRLYSSLGSPIPHLIHLRIWLFEYSTQ